MPALSVVVSPLIGTMCSCGWPAAALVQLVVALVWLPALAAESHVDLGWAPDIDGHVGDGSCLVQAVTGRALACGAALARHHVPCALQQSPVCTAPSARRCLCLGALLFVLSCWGVPVNVAMGTATNHGA